MSDTTIDYARLASAIKTTARLRVCEHEKSRRGFWGDLCADGWKVDKSCTELQTVSVTNCCTAISTLLDVDEEAAKKILDQLRDLSWIQVWSCGRVSFPDE